MTRTTLRRLFPAGLVAVLALAAAIVVTLTPGPPPTTSEQLGEPCGRPGLVAVDSDGRRLTCTTTVADPQPRWRTGQLDLPSR